MEIRVGVVILNPENRELECLLFDGRRVLFSQRRVTTPRILRGSVHLATFAEVSRPVTRVAQVNDLLTVHIQLNDQGAHTAYRWTFESEWHGVVEPLLQEAPFQVVERNFVDGRYYPPIELWQGFLVDPRLSAILPLRNRPLYRGRGGIPRRWFRVCLNGQWFDLGFDPRSTR